MYAIVASVETLSASCLVISSTEWLSYKVFAASIIVGVGAYGLMIQSEFTSGSFGYFSNTFDIKLETPCTPHRILVSRLEKIVLDDIRKVSEYVFLHEKEFITHFLNRSEKEMKKMQTEASSKIINANKRCDEINKIIRKLYEDNVSGRITDERFDYLSKSYEEEQNELNRKVQELKEILAVVDSDNEKLAKFIRIVKQYTEIEELTPDILHSFVDRIYIGETEVYEGQKFQDIKIVYNLVGAIDLPQYAM